MKVDEYTKVNFKKLSLIFEFGGGYGNMCRLINKMGFKGKYIIYDLPEFSSIQRFYLKLNNITDVSCISDLGKLNTALAKYSNKKDRLFLATWSLSESPLLTRDQIKALVKNFKYHLISYQSSFDCIDNINYFDNFQKYLTTHRWFNHEIKQLPNNHYLFGLNKQS